MTAEEDTPPADAANLSTAPSFRGALASRDFALLFGGQLGSEIGNGLIQLALPWLVLELTGSAFQLGFAYFFQFLPILIFGLAGGVFVDRWDRRLTIIVADILRGLAFLSVGAFAVYGLFTENQALQVEHLYAVIFFESTLVSFFNPARAALVPNLVSRDNLRAANSLTEIARHIGFLIAPPVGGVVLALLDELGKSFGLQEGLGPSALMLTNGVTFLISAILVGMIRWRPPPREPVPSEGFLDSLQQAFIQAADGIGALARSRLLQLTVFLGFSLNLIIAPVQVLLPLFVRNVKDADASYFGILVAGLVVGLLTGSLTAPALSHRLGLGRMTIIAVFVLGVVISIAAWPPMLWPAVIAMTIAGVAIGSLNVAQTTMLQTGTTDEERGRVTAIYFTVTLGVRSFSFLALGALAALSDDPSWIQLLFLALGFLALVVGGLLAGLPHDPRDPLVTRPPRRCSRASHALSSRRRRWRPHSPAWGASTLAPPRREAPWYTVCTDAP